MKRLINLLVAVLLLGLLLAYMMSFTVRFNEAAIVTTFGSADEDSVINDVTEDGQLGNGAGLHFKWPWPIQQVARKFDTRIQTVTGPLEQVPTADNQTLLLSLYVNWRVTDPLEFYNALNTMENANARILSIVRSAASVVAQYEFAALVNDDPNQLKLDEIGDRIRQSAQASVNENGYGISIEQIGIKRMVLPDEVSSVVFQRMIAERSVLATSIAAEGNAARDAAVSTANTNARLIQSFADTQAARITTEGQRNANLARQGFAEAEEFAIFLKSVETWRQALASQTRFYIDAKYVFPFNLMYRSMGGPDTPPQNASADADN